MEAKYEVDTDSRSVSSNDLQSECTCQQHLLPAVVFCKECNKPLCADCLTEHKKHNYLTFQEIEGEAVPLMTKRRLKYEGYLKGLAEQRERLINRIRNIRTAQEERELALKIYMQNVEKLIYKKHNDMIVVEEEMISKLIPLSFRVEKQISAARTEIAECKARLEELQGAKQPERTWKAIHIISEKKACIFEEDQNVQQQQQSEALLGGGPEVPLGVLFDQIPPLDAINLDAKHVALKAEKTILKENIKKLSEQFVGLQDKYRELLRKLGQIKGTVMCHSRE